MNLQWVVTKAHDGIQRFDHQCDWNASGNRDALPRSCRAGAVRANSRSIHADHGCGDSRPGGYPLELPRSRGLMGLAGERSERITRGQAEVHRPWRRRLSHAQPPGRLPGRMPYSLTLSMIRVARPGSDVIVSTPPRPLMVSVSLAASECAIRMKAARPDTSTTPELAAA